MNQDDPAVTAQPLIERIISELTRKDGQTAVVLAHALGVTKQDVNRALYGPLKGRVTQDRRFAWSLRKIPTQASGDGFTVQDTDLARLAEYYLDCLARDSGAEVSVWASSLYNNGLDYAELPSLPLGNVDGGEVLAHKPAAAITQGAFGKRMIVYLGYPTRLNRFRSKKGTWIQKVEPVLLFELVRQEDGHVSLETDRPRINLSVLKALSGGQDSSAITDEWITLGLELGLSSIDTQAPSIDDLALRLRTLRPEWDWIEELDPHRLANSPPLASVQQAGIYNRAVVVRSDAPHFTKGLEQELAALKAEPRERYAPTALGAWLAGPVTPAPQPSSEPLVEVVPLNQEQRDAVQRSLTQPLTVITGPPGTGKSQVVTALLANAALRGMRVLLTSKNNKAVDVVEERINALGDRPVLLRLGASRYLNALSDYLARVLSTTATESDRNRLSEVQRERNTILAELSVLDQQIQTTVRARNLCDIAEQAVQEIRTSVGGTVFSRMRGADVALISSASERFQHAVRRADRSAQSLLARLVWPILRGARLEALREVGVVSQSA